MKLNLLGEPIVNISIVQDYFIPLTHRPTMSSNEDDLKKGKRPCYRTLKEYSSASTTHGIAYVFEDGRLIFERVLWVIVVGIAIAIGTYWSITAYENWQDMGVGWQAPVWHRVR